MGKTGEAQAHAAITEMIQRYCRAVDRIDVPLGRSIWHDDATADYGRTYQGPGADAIDHICAQHRKTLATSHCVSNMAIAIDGNRATSETYVTAAIRIAHGDGQREIGVHGRYLDRWSCRAGRWALDHRRFVLDFDEIRDVVPAGGDCTGRQDRSDPSYELFEDPQG